MAADELAELLFEALRKQSARTHDLTDNLTGVMIYVPVDLRALAMAILQSGLSGRHNG